MIVLLNAKIHTMDPNQPVVSSIVIDGGRIIASGDDAQICREFGISKPGVIHTNRGSVRSFDMVGQTILPGLTDAHIHLEKFSLNLQKIDCETTSRQECIKRVADTVKYVSPGTWVLGHGWNQNSWHEGFGSSVELDKVSPENPVYLTAKSLHAAWVNSEALRIAGIDKHTQDPPDGKIGREKSGDPNGILYESAMDLVSRTIPEESVEQIAIAIANAQTILIKMGITGVHDFDRRNCFSALQTLRQANLLKLRTLKSMPYEDLDHVVALGLQSGFGDEFLKIGGIKAFADGALGPRTAAMIKGYNGESENRGMLFLDREELYERGRLAVDNGLSLAVHAIGDLANHEVLNAFTQLRNYEEGRHSSFDSPKPQNQFRKRLRHRIEHVQLIHPSDAARLAELGVIASMQPIHAISDMQMAERYWGDRSNNAYAWRLQLDHGAILAFGSDAPVDSPNPFWGVHAAVTRRRADGYPEPQGWIPEQRLSVGEALWAYTVGPSIAAGWEDRLGKLTPGYYADLIVLDEDPFTCSLDNLYGLQSTATMVAGEWVYNSI